MAIDKSLRQHYETQGGVKNYLGKQKMVKAPKYWLSKPGHVKAKLAYITDEEEQILIDKNLYGSLRGRPNKGPAGLPSLQGGDFGAGRSDSGSRNGSHDRGGWQHHRAAAPKPAPKPAPTVTQTAAMEDIGARDTIASLTSGPSPHGDRDTNIQEQRKLDIQQLIAKQQEEKFGPGADPTKFGEAAPRDLRTQKEKDEDWERAQDWDKVKELADRGESFEDIQSAMDKGLLMKQDAIRRQGLIERGLAAVMPKTKLESGLLGSLKKTFDPRRLATNFALRKMGLSWLNPLMGLASLFGLPQKAKSMIASRRTPAFDPAKARQLGLYADRVPTDTTKYARVGEPYRQPDLTKQIAGKGDYISKSIAKFTGKGDDRSGIKGLRTEVPLAGQHFLPGMHPFSGTEPPLTQEQINNMYKLKLAKAEQLTLPGMQNMPSGYPWSMQGEGASPESWITKVAKGGRVDKALGGRVRDI